MSIKILPGTQNDRSHWGDNPVIAIDLGMSECNSTTGFAYAPANLFDMKYTSFGSTIGDCVSRICEVVNRPDAPSKIAIIIEAPLSFAFDEPGNPTTRRPIEVTDQVRPWHHQPACGLGLLAVLVLRRILAKAQPKGRHVTLHVFEGFISGKISETGPPARHRSHRRDAHNLVTAFLNKKHLISREANATESLLPLVDSTVGRAIPAIIQVTQKHYEFI